MWQSSDTKYYAIIVFKAPQALGQEPRSHTEVAGVCILSVILPLVFDRAVRDVLFCNDTVHPIVAAYVFETWENFRGAVDLRPDDDVVVITGESVVDNTEQQSQVRGIYCVDVRRVMLASI